MTGYFVLSIDTEDPIAPRRGNGGWNAGDRRRDAAREAAARFMRLLDGHAMSATWVFGQTALLEAWGRRRSDGFSDRSEDLLGAVGGMATRQEIALSASGDHETRLERCARFAEDNGTRVCTVAVAADEAVDLDGYAAFGFTACRRTPSPTRPSPLTDDLFQRPVPMWRPSDLECVGPILNVPVSISLANIDTRRRLVPEAVRISRIRRGLERAASDGALVHLAFRLGDLEHSESLFRTIEDILFHVAETRAGGGLRIATVAELRGAYDSSGGADADRQAA